MGEGMESRPSLLFVTLNVGIDVAVAVASRSCVHLSTVGRQGSVIGSDCAKQACLLCRPYSGGLTAKC